MINNKLNELKTLDLSNIKIELIGSWLWLTGDTFNIKEQLKNLGFFYSANKKAWFYNGSDYKLNRAFYKDLNQIKEKYIFKEINLKEV